MLKTIKIVSGMEPWNTKIYVGGKDIIEEIGGIFGVDVKLRVDCLPKITIHRHTTNVGCEIENSRLNIINHEPKKVKGTDTILEDTDYPNCKGARHYIKKGSKGV